MSTEVERLPWEVDEPEDVVQAMAVNDELPDEGVVTEVEVPRALAVQPTGPITDHVIVGLGALAKMSDAEFEEKLAMLVRGRERVELIQKNLMRKGVDYGTVPGIDRPFLHLPGAEALEKFYGYVAEQRTFRFVGDNITEPALTYRTDTLVHLGDLTGPVVAMVSASCNSFEDRYRYRWQNPTCPNCGREGLVKRKSPASLAGKWNCPSFYNKGGCNAVFEPNDPTIQPAQKVEFDNPWSNDETLIQISQKRSYVAAIRRATGTSGIFTIDEDAPSVQEQSKNSADFGDGDETPKFENVTGTSIAAGGKEVLASAVQLRELVALSREKDLGPAGIAALLKRLFDLDIAETQKAVSDAAKALTGEQIGALLLAIQTGAVPEMVEDPTPMPGTAEAAAQPYGDPDFTPDPPRRGRPPGSKNKPKEPETFEADA